MLATTAALRGGEPADSAVQSNLEIIQHLTRQATEDVILHAQMRGGDSVFLRCDSTAEAWITTDAVAEALRSHDCHVFTSTDSLRDDGYLMNVHAAGPKLLYDNLFRDGFFGKEYVTRSLSAQIAFSVVRISTKEIVFSSTIEKSARDTVALDDIPQLETRSAKSTQGIAPSETFLDRAIEPLMIIGATGIAVYLLFHIRS